MKLIVTDSFEIQMLQWANKSFIIMLMIPKILSQIFTHINFTVIAFLCDIFIRALPHLVTTPASYSSSLLIPLLLSGHQFFCCLFPPKRDNILIFLCLIYFT